MKDFVVELLRWLWLVLLCVLIVASLVAIFFGIWTDLRWTATGAVALIISINALIFTIEVTG